MPPKKNKQRKTTTTTKSTHTHTPGAEEQKTYRKAIWRAQQKKRERGSLILPSFCFPFSFFLRETTTGWMSLFHLSLFRFEKNDICQYVDNFQVLKTNMSANETTSVLFFQLLALCVCVCAAHDLNIYIPQFPCFCLPSTHPPTLKRRVRRVMQKPKSVNLVSMWGTCGGVAVSQVSTPVSHIPFLYFRQSHKIYSREEDCV